MNWERTDFPHVMFILINRFWDKTKRSRVDWKQLKRDYLESPDITGLPELHPGIYNQDGSPQAPPVPYEQEYQFRK